MNSKYAFVVAAMAVMLIGATALATQDALADGKKHYSKSQAVSQVNDCGNGELPENVFCSNTASQVQGDENAPSLSSSQGSSEEDNAATPVSAQTSN
jgi:hypothetical protein